MYREKPKIEVEKITMRKSRKVENKEEVGENRLGKSREKEIELVRGKAFKVFNKEEHLIPSKILNFVVFLSR